MTETRECQSCKAEFTIEPDDFSFYEKMKVPAPTFCPECRMIRRMCHRNEHVFYNTTCQATGKNIISVFNPESDIIVYDPYYWRSDAFDAIRYFEDIDWSIPFFEQYYVFKKKVPHPGLDLEFCLDSPYNNYSTRLSNTYFSIRTHRSKNCSYIYNGRDLENCADCLGISESEYLVECVDTHNSSFSAYLEICNYISYSYFLYNCRNSFHCFMSSNQNNKQYVFRNIQLSKEQYEEKMSHIDLKDFDQLDVFCKEFEALKKTSIKKGPNQILTVQSTGEGLRECSNVKDCFYMNESSDSRYCVLGNRFKTSYDAYTGSGNELTYETGGVGHMSFAIGSYQVTDSVNVYYSTYCDYCKDIFGCMGLQNKKYCIFNKQYTKEEYHEILPRLITHMMEMPFIGKNNKQYQFGDFFPEEHSLFSYNETVAQDYFPLRKEEISGNGFGFKDKVKKEYTITYRASDLFIRKEYNFSDFKNTVISCMHEETGQHLDTNCSDQCPKAFLVTENEIEIRNRIGIALPLECPQCRYVRRLKKRSQFKLFKRSCMCDEQGHFHGNSHCREEFEASYPSDQSDTIYCEKCYQQEVI